ncbi:MAG: vWA domain-containing protein [Vulcanimicrobiota bacterium]
MVNRAFSIILLALFIFFSMPCRADQFSTPQKSETITKTQRDTILLMCATENPNYDIVLAIDISNSMDAVLSEWKAMAEKTIDIAQNGDTLVLLRFDANTKPPIIQEVQTERDKELFKSNVKKTVTTHGWGTDIRRAYWQTLKTLNEFNEGRSKKGEPVRLQQVVFISDGDDLPPDNSPFRNPGSVESIEMMDLISNAQKNMRINILPIGMKFENYVPKVRTIKTEGSAKPGDEKISKELKEFMEKLQDVLNRQYSAGIKEDKETVPKAPFDFYINWLSGHFDLKEKQAAPSKNPMIKPYCYDMVSRFRKLKVKDLAVSGSYQGSGGGTIQKGVKVSATSLAPGSTGTLLWDIQFPKNWSFTAKPYQGTVDVDLSGTMEVDIETTPANPADPKKVLSYSYPFIPKKISVQVSGTLPPSTELYVVTIGSFLALLLGFALYVFKNALPITITLKTESKSQAFSLKNGESITVGGGSDFELAGCSIQAASLKRDGRAFYISSLKEGVFADPASAGPKGLPVQFGQSFNLNVEGTYFAVQMLEGDQADALPEDAPAEMPTGDDGGEPFKF